MNIAELDVLPSAIRDLILAKHYKAIHADKLGRCVGESTALKFYSRPLPEDQGRGYYRFTHPLPKYDGWLTRYNLDPPLSKIKAREYQVAMFREWFFHKHNKPRKFCVFQTPIYNRTYTQPHLPKTDAEMKQELVESEAERFV